jgi:SET domain-containing protein
MFNCGMVAAPSDLLIEFRSSSIHGRGGYARVDISAGARIVEYLGGRITKEESLRQCELENPYIFSISEEFDLDGNVDWNPARLLNHSCSANAEAHCLDGRIWIVALRDICAGEEVTFNYNYDLQDYQEHPCQCGSENCVGYIVAEEFFGDVQRANTWRQTMEK